MRALAGDGPTLRRIAYVSCDPASFARDVRTLFDEGWSLGSLRAFDIFPMTEHVELVAGLDPPARWRRVTVMFSEAMNRSGHPRQADRPEVLYACPPNSCSI